MAGVGGWLCMAFLGLGVARGASPVVVGGWPTTARLSSAEDVAVFRVGNQPWAFVAAGVSGVHVLSLANVDAPTWVGHYDTPGHARAVAVVRHPTSNVPYAFVADGAGGLSVLDVSSPAQPRRVGGIEDGGEFLNVMAAGGLVYAAHDVQGLMILDPRTPANPVVQASLPGTGRLGAMAIAGGRVYVADDAVGLRVMDVSTPGVIRALGSYTNAARIEGVAVEGSYAYIVDGTNGLSAIDVSVPSAPVRRGRATTFGLPHDVAVKDGVAYVAGVTFQPFMLIDPAQPVPNGSGKSTGGNGAAGVEMFEDHAYVLDRNVGLRVFKVTNPGVPAITGAGFNWEGTATDVASTVSGAFMAVADGRSGLRVVEVTNPAKPGGALGEFTLSTAGQALGVTVVGTVGYVANGAEGLVTVDLRDPRNPRLGGTYRFPDATGFARRVVVDGTTAYLASGRAGLTLIDVAGGVPGGVRSTVSTTDEVWGVAVTNGVAYVAAGGEGLVVVDVGVPETPRVVTTFPVPGADAVVRGVAVRGNYAYLAAGGAGMVVVDLTSPTNPRLVKAVGGEGAATGVRLEGRYALVSRGEAGVQVIDVQDPSNPVVAGRLDTDGEVGGIAVNQGYVYAADASRMLVLAVDGISPAPNQAPSFVLGTTVVVREDTGLWVLTNWVTGIRSGPVEEAAQSLTFLPVQTGSPEVFSEGPTVDLQGTLRFRLATNAFGRVSCQLTLVDDGGTVNGGVDHADQSFVVEVLPVNDPPIIDSLSDIGWREDGTGRIVNLSGIFAGPKNELQNLTLTVVSDRPEVVANPGIDYTSPETAARLFVQSKSNWFGRVWMTLTLKDDGGTANGGRDAYVNRFRVSVREVDDAPFITIDEPLDGTVFFPGSPVGIVITSTDDEGPVQWIELSADNGPPIMHKDLPNETETVTWLQPTPGLHVLRVKGVDSDGLSYTSPPVRIVMGVPPSITGTNRLELAEDTVSPPIPFQVRDNLPVPVTPQTQLKVTATSSNPALIPAAGLKFTGDAGVRSLTVTPAENAAGRATVAVVVMDGDGLTATNQLDVLVTPVNDPPTVALVRPAAGTIVPPGGSVTLEAVAADVEGPVAAVEFRDAEKPLVRLTQSPWVWIWNQPPAGEHRLTAMVTDFDGLSTETAEVGITVDRAVNQLPTMAGAHAVVVAEDGISEPMVLTLGDDTTPAEALKLRVTCSDAVLVPSARIVVTGAGATRTVSVQPAPDAFGTATLELTVEDADGGVTRQSVSLTVTSVNDAPTLSGARAVDVAEDGASDPMELTVGDDTTSAGALLVQVTCSDPVLLPVGRITVSGTGATRTVRVVPAANASGTASLLITVQDAEGAITRQTMPLTVTPVNDAPSVALLVPVEGATFRTGTLLRMEATASDVEPGALPVTFYVDEVAVGRAPAAPYVSVTTNGIVGEHRLTAVVTDGGGLSTTSAVVRIQVELPPNQPPTITGGGPLVMTEDPATAGSINVTVADDRTPAGSVLLRATVSNAALIPADGVSLRVGEGGGWIVSVQPATNAFGTADLVLVATDGDGLRTTNHFPITVTPVNDAPVAAIRRPLDGTEVTLGDSVRFEAVIEDPDSTIAQVEYVQNGVVRGTGLGAAYAWDWTPTLVGESEWVARARDAEGVVGSSAPVRITVRPPANLPPRIVGGGPLSLYRDSVSPPLELALSDDHTAVDALAVRVVAANAVLFPATGLSLSGTGAVRTLRIEPAVGQSGNGFVEVIATDADGLSGTNAVPVTVLPVSELPGGETCFADSVPAGYGTYNLLKHAKFQQSAGGRPLATGAVASIELRAPPTYTIRSAVVSGGTAFRVNLARRDDGLFTWSDSGDEAALLSRLPFGAWNTSYRLALPSGEAFNGFFPYTILSNLPPVPDILNLEAGQAIRPDAAFTLSWSPWTGSSTNDRVLLTLVDANGKVVVSAASDCSGQTVLPRRSGSLEVPAGRLAPGSRYTGFLTFGATQLSINDKSPLLMLRAFHSRTTQFELQTTGDGGGGSAAKLGGPRFVAGNVAVTLNGRAGAVHRIESSRDLATWSPVREVTLDAAGSAEVLLPLGAAVDARFYRAVLVSGAAVR